MSSYGNPGQPPTPYGEPVDPFSGPTSPAEGWSAPPPVSPAPQQPYSPPPPAPGGYAPGQAAPTYSPGGSYNPGGYAAQPEYGYDTETQGWQAPRRQGSKTVVVLVTTFVVLLLVGAGLATLLFLNKDGDTNSATCPTTATANPHCFNKGECLLQQGTNSGGAPLLQQVPCNTVGAYEVIERFDGTADRNACNNVAGTTAPYFFDANQGTKNDLVLCLKKH
jgi:hypothetical protein